MGYRRRDNKNLWASWYRFNQSRRGHKVQVSSSIAVRKSRRSVFTSTAGSNAMRVSSFVLRKWKREISFQDMVEGCTSSTKGLDNLSGLKQIVHYGVDRERGED